VQENVHVILLSLLIFNLMTLLEPIMNVYLGYLLGVFSRFVAVQSLFYVLSRDLSSSFVWFECHVFFCNFG